MGFFCFGSYSLELFAFEDYLLANILFLIEGLVKESINFYCQIK